MKSKPSQTDWHQMAYNKQMTNDTLLSWYRHNNTTDVWNPIRQADAVINCTTSEIILKTAMLTQNRKNVLLVQFDNGKASCLPNFQNWRGSISNNTLKFVRTTALSNCSLYYGLHNSTRQVVTHLSMSKNESCIGIHLFETSWSW
jgi:hypothetical protein